MIALEEDNMRKETLKNLNITEEQFHKMVDFVLNYTEKFNTSDNQNYDAYYYLGYAGRTGFQFKQTIEDYSVDEIEQVHWFYNQRKEFNHDCILGGNMETHFKTLLSEFFGITNTEEVKSFHVFGIIESDYTPVVHHSINSVEAFEDEQFTYCRYLAVFNNGGVASGDFSHQDVLDHIDNNYCNYYNTAE